MNVEGDSEWALPQCPNDYTRTGIDAVMSDEVKDDDRIATLVCS